MNEKDHCIVDGIFHEISEKTFRDKNRDLTAGPLTEFWDVYYQVSGGDWTMGDREEGSYDAEPEPEQIIIGLMRDELNNIL